MVEVCISTASSDSEGDAADAEFGTAIGVFGLRGVHDLPSHLLVVLFLAYSQPQFNIKHVSNPAYTSDCI